jgi:glycosyltransferase involved in cell wall biosynthesis
VPLRHASYSDRRPWELLHAASALSEAQEFDVIHNHAGESVVAMANMVDVPMLSTLHCAITADTLPLWSRYQGWYNTVSSAQARGLPELEHPRFAGVVYNAIEVATFPFQPEKEDFLLFLSRVCPEKGTTLAIEVARRLNRRLIIAGKVDPVDVAYFESEVKPLIDGEQVVFFGEADGRQKRDLYSRALCLLAPIQWEEPFGLVLAEAQACGTPVVTCPRGAAPEVVEHGITGYLSDTVEGLCQAVENLPGLDPAACRARVERYFDVPQMVDGYEQLYGKMLRHAELVGGGGGLEPSASTLPS